ncbi:divalent cation tolerance protein CutA [Candidatus Nomurabacteria bacterium]|uniref:Divalent cation tolerance protein CutA n=1 Tax=Candidatus Dojkabacteria bacterium TaxID=2099670 RepID=A0A955I1Y3_9BACT|nr:divalent cation tolerance protein CutA [Candidatus Dojkabacteria bacterium]MCB9790038.1 divalent cation tolerance protein CutA [Candidatus Nomurabacteria bacterium]
MMEMDIVAIIINIPCPTFEEADKHARILMKKELCGLVRIYRDVNQIYFTEEGEVDGEDIVMLAIKTTQKNLKEIEAYMLKNHSWGTPCIDVTPIVTDHC